MKKMNLESFGVQEMTQEELMAIEGGSIFSKTWGGIKAAAEFVADVAVDVWEWCVEHGHTDTNNPGFTV
ncbi:MAG: hypothetical protein LBT43_00810 [Prevotella sp.]|jgi:hypothetical protein|nr:hypothetical protein [Prevotella sp.]